METIAAKIANRVPGGGIHYKTEKGTDLAKLCERLGTTRRDTGYVVTEFHDDSAIVFTDGGWDVRHPDCTCGTCWVEEGGPPPCVANSPTTWTIRDQHGCWDKELECDEDTLVADVQFEIDNGDYGMGPYEKSWQLHISAESNAGEEVSFNIDILPVEPECDDEHQDHEWEEVSVQGHGGGVVIVEQCAHCGLRKRTDTWDTCSDCGRNYRSLQYLEPSED